MTFWIEDSGNQIIIGKNTTTEDRVQIAACEGTSVEVGEDCMFSHDIYIRTTDSHSITDMQGLRLNQAEDIKIGNHVWIGMQCLVLKGADIPDRCVVGARSLVSKKEFDSNSVIAGMPAKTVRTNIDWKRSR